MVEGARDAVDELVYLIVVLDESAAIAAEMTSTNDKLAQMLRLVDGDAQKLGRRIEPLADRVERVCVHVRMEHDVLAAIVDAVLAFDNDEGEVLAELVP